MGKREGSLDRPTALLVTAEAGSRRAIPALLPDYLVQEATSEAKLRRALAQGGLNLVLVREGDPWPDALTVLQEARAAVPLCPVIALFDRSAPERAEVLVRAGVDDYVSSAEDLPTRLPLAARACVDRHRALASLDQAEAHYRDLFESFPVGLYRTSTDGVILDANQELCDMLGYSDREALLRRNAADLYVEPRERRVILASQGSKSVLHAVEVQLRCADGRTIWVEDHARIVRDARGKVQAYEGSLVDITRRKQAEQALRAREERFRALVQNAADVITTLDGRGSILSVTPSAERILGYVPEELVGQNGLALIHPDDLSRVAEALQEVVERRNPGTPTEFRIRHRDGSWVFLEAVASNLTERPEVGAIVLTARAIGERKQAEAALRESERRLSTLLANLPGMAYRCRNDRAWTMEFVSDGCLALTGYAPADLVNNARLSFASLIQPEDQEQVWEEIQQAVQAGRRFQLSYRIATAQGEVRWVWGQGGAVGLAADGTEILEGFIADVTSRREAEDELAQSRAWLQHVIEAVDDLLVVHDGEGRYVDVVARDASLLARPADEMLGRRVTEILPEETARRFLQGIRIVLTQGATYEFEYPLLLPGGRRWFRARGRRIRVAENEPPRTLWAISEITAQKSAEQERVRQGRQLEILSRTSQQLNAVLDIPVVLRTLVAAGMELAGATAGTAGLWLDERMRFTEYNQDGLLRPLDLVLAAGEGVPGVVAETRTRYVTHAPQAQPHPAYGGPAIRIRSLIDVPILSRDGELLGCLELHNPRDEQGFDDQDVSMLEGLASGAAVALENARLLEERQRVEEDLRQLKEFNEDIVLSMGEGILVQDRLGHFSFVNPAATAMLGYRPEELLQASWRTIVPPDQHAIVNAVDADRVRGAASRYELEFVCKDGRRLAALVSGSPRFKDGRFEGMLAVFADISERKAAEQALRESEEQFRSVAERSPNMIFINQRGHIVYVNPQCSEVMAYRPEEFLSPDFRFETLVAPDSLATVREAFSRHGRGEDVAPYEYELVTRNGKLLTVINATKLITFRGAPAILGVVTDITERKRAEEAVRESERRFRLLVERAADAVFLHDLEGRIVDVNQRACGSLGYTRDELLGMRVDDVEAQVDPAAQRDLWRQAAAGPQTLEGTHRRKDGSTFPVELRIGAFDVDGRPHILALARDISERRRADEALRETTQTLQALVQAAPVGVVVLDLQGNIRIWNPAAERIFRVSAGNVVDQALEALRSVNAENVAAFVGIQEQLMRGEAVSNTEVKAFRSDGVPLDVAISAAPLRDAEGHVQALMGVLDDITERKRAEVAIERHMRELSVLYETSLEVAQRSDAHQILEVIVAQAAGLMGARMGGIYLLSDDGSSLELAVIHNLPETLRGTRLALGEGLSGKVAQSGAAMTVEDYAVWAGRFPGYEGAPFRRVAAAPLKRAGRVIGVINVTDSERTGPFEADEVRVLQLFADQAAVSLENARLLRETRQRAAHLEAVTALGTALRGRRTRREALPIVAEHLMDLLRPDGVLVALEDAGNQDVVVERGVGVWAGLEGARQGRAHGLLGRVMATGQAVVISGPGELREAREPLDLASASTLALIPLVEQEHVLGVIGVGRGSAFTEPERRLLMALAEVIGNALRRLAVLETLEERVRVRTQELADANLRLTELDRLKSDFVSNVSHELRTPITNVLLYLDLLEQPSRQDRREAYMTVLRRESERLGHLIEDLLTLSRMDQAALKVNLELRALDPLLGEIQASHRARALAKGIDLGLEPNPDVPPVWLDYAQIVQVLNNLVANAIAYTPSGGQVSLCSLLREAEGGRREAGARVHNDGPIIPAEDRPRLFERFFRGRTGRESGEPGTGLGLAICKEIVDRHGGWIEVESSEGEGTRFTVWLPLGAEG